jgi:hypothetical protein
MTRVDVTFNPEKTAVVAIECFSLERQTSCPPICGVTYGDSEQEVIRKLGTPGTSGTVVTPFDHKRSTVFMGYPNLGVELSLLWSGRVYMLGVYDPKYPPADCLDIGCTQLR